jgi:hypothetical protein
MQMIVSCEHARRHSLCRTWGKINISAIGRRRLPLDCQERKCFQLLYYSGLIRWEGLLVGMVLSSRVFIKRPDWP